MPLSSGLGSILSAIPAMPRTAGAPGAPGAAPAPPPGPMMGQGAPPGPGGPGADVFAAAINKKLSESQGPDPEHVANVLKEMKSTILALMPKIAFRMPNVDKHLNTAYRSLTSAYDEAQKALQQIAAQKPIDFSGAMGGGPAGPTAPGPL